MKLKTIIAMSAAVLVGLPASESLAQGQSGNGPGAAGPSERVCALLGMLGAPLPPGCRKDDGETGGDDEVYGTFPPSNVAACPELPMMRPWPEFSTLEVEEDGRVIIVNGPESLFAAGTTARDPLPNNLCQTVYEEVRNADGSVIPHSLPSTPENPYNLHPDPVVSEIDPRAPTDDLRMIVSNLRAAVAGGEQPDLDDIEFGLDILEGNPIDRSYSGFPLLHYNGYNKVQKVEPIYDDEGNVVGGNVDVHQIWAGQRIMSNAASIDTAAVKDVPWTITYIVDTLNRGREDFAPFGMFFNDPIDPIAGKMPGIGIDQTFFPMEDGTRTIFKIPHPPARQYKLTYNWGWRIHPPRVQASENAQGIELEVPIPYWERCVFGEEPQGSEENKLAAIAMIGDLAPAKRMWIILREMRSAPNLVDEDLIDAFDAAFADWENRTRLPSGVERDDDYDITLLYANNTLYGDTAGSVASFQKKAPFYKRGQQVKVRVLNADYFERAHMIVDFGGLRGYENTYHHTIPIGGAGPWFTFGRAYWFPFLPGPQPVPAATPPADSGVEISTIAECQERFSIYNLMARGEIKKHYYARTALEMPSSLSMVDEELQTIVPLPERHVLMSNGSGPQLGERIFILNFNHEPSARISIYQFDQLHHDVAVWSTH